MAKHDDLEVHGTTRAGRETSEHGDESVENAGHSWSASAAFPLISAHVRVFGPRSQPAIAQRLRHSPHLRWSRYDVAQKQHCAVGHPPVRERHLWPCGWQVEIRSLGRGGADLLVHRAVSRYLDNMSVIDSTALPGAPLDALRELARTEAELDDIRRRQVAEARRTGATWDEIGDALGMSRQGAWEYFAKRAQDRLAESAAANEDLSEDEAMQIAVEEVRAVRRERRAER